MKYCAKCGQEVMEEAVVCPHCGCEVETPKKTKRTAWRLPVSYARSLSLCSAGFSEV